MINNASVTENSALDYISSLTLLCVEDNKTTQMTYSLMLEDVCKEVIFADDGADGLKKYLKNKIDIIISDYFMPNVNGLDMIKSIRDIDKNIPIILVSAIEDIDIIVKALRLRVNNFIKKPIITKEVLDALSDASKLLIADRYLKEKEKYNSYQQDLAFAKELNILRNDFYYQMIVSDYITMVDFLYHPLDILSGDAYSARKISKSEALYLVVDGMGKGISASLSSMLITSFINHHIDKMLSSNNFTLYELIDESIEYIKPILLEEEALAIDYILVNSDINTLKYAKFAMPSILMQNSKDEILKIRSNNPPLSKYTPDFKISTYDISDINKFLFYSDGLVENTTIHNDTIYADFIEDDFKNAFTREDFKNALFNKVKVQEDDITLTFINRLNVKDTLLIKKSFKSSLDEIDLAGEWYASLWEELSDDAKAKYNASVVFTELVMNAFEHGNLGLTLEAKSNLLEEDIYFETLANMQEECNKNILVEVSRIDHAGSTYIVTQITDEGEGFDTQILSTIFRNTQIFNGRGVFVSRQSSLGIYYNSIGNSVLFLHKA